MKPAAHWSSTTFSHIFTVWLISLSHLYLLGLCTSPLLLENQHQHICSMIVFNSQFKNSTALSLSLSLSARYHTCTGLPSGPHALPLSIPFTAALTSSLLTLSISWITNRHPSLLPHLSLIFLHSPQSTPSNLFNTPPSLAGTFPPLSSIQTCCTSFPHRCKSFFSLLTETIQPFNEWVKRQHPSEQKYKTLQVKMTKKSLRKSAYPLTLRWLWTGHRGNKTLALLSEWSTELHPHTWKKETHKCSTKTNSVLLWFPLSDIPLSSSVSPGQWSPALYKRCHPSTNQVILN